VGLPGSPRHLDVALGMEEDQTAHGRDADGRRERHAEQPGAQIDLSHVHEHVLRDREAIQVAPVAAQRRFGFAAAIAEVPRFASEARVGSAADLGKSCKWARELSGLGHGAVLYASPCPESWYTAAARKVRARDEMAARRTAQRRGHDMSGNGASAQGVKQVGYFDCAGGGQVVEVAY